jgi:hypothetical protein
MSVIDDMIQAESADCVNPHVEKQENEMASIPKSVSSYMAEIGAKGGAATGKVKKRGSSEYYKKLRAKRTRKEKAAK